MIKCQVCGYENPDDMQVCMNCGSPVDRQKVSEAMDDISGEATVLIGAPPPPAPRASSSEQGSPPPPERPQTPPPPPPPERPQAPPQNAPPPPPPPPTGYTSPGMPPGNMGAPPAGSLPPGGYSAGGAPKQNVLAIVSLISGILSLLLCCCFYLWVPTSIIAIVTGFMARKQIQESNGAETGDNLAIAGMICGAVALVVYTIMSLTFLIFGDSLQSWAETMQQQQQQNLP